MRHDASNVPDYTLAGQGRSSAWGADLSQFSLDGRPLHQFMNVGSFAEMTVIYADMKPGLLTQTP